MVARAVTLYHSGPDFEVFVFPDASHAQWGSLLTQVPRSECHGGIPVESMCHQPLDFLSDKFNGSQISWGSVDEKAFAIISTFRCLDYLGWNHGVRLLTDCRNLACVPNLRFLFHPCPRHLPNVRKIGKHLFLSIHVPSSTISLESVMRGVISFIVGRACCNSSR